MTTKSSTAFPFLLGAIYSLGALFPVACSTTSNDSSDPGAAGGGANAAQGGAGAGGGNSADDLSRCAPLPATVDEDLNVGPACVLVDTTEVSNGATLSIAPGTIVAMAPGGRLAVGDGTLHAVGTIAKPVVFRSVNPYPAAGDWQCLYFGEGSDGSELQNFIVRHGGSACEATGHGYEADIVVEAPIRTLTDGILSDSAGAGLHIPRFGAAPRALAALSFEFNRPPSLIVGADLHSAVGSGISFLPPTDDFAQIEGDASAGGTLVALPVPWHLPADFHLTLAQKPLVVEAGATLLMEGGSLDADIGALRLEGTEDKPITVGSARPTPAAGDWGCLWLNGGDDFLSHVKLEYAGGGSGCTGAHYNTAIFTAAPGAFDTVSFANIAGSALLNGESLAACGSHSTSWCGPASPFTYDTVEEPYLECLNGPGATIVGLCP